MASPAAANAQIGSILIHLVDGTRQPLPSTVKWSARIHDGRSPGEWKMFHIGGVGPAELIKGLPFFDNFFDNYTVIVTADQYEDAAWMPVHIAPNAPASVYLMLLPKDAHLNFSAASWQSLHAIRPRFVEIISSGIGNAESRYADLMEEQQGLVLGCTLNLLTAMSMITLPSGKSPLDYFWQPIWDDSAFAMAQDRFFAYVDKALVNDVSAAAKIGAFAEEKDPGVFHPGATLSYKQTQFDVANVQLTFHQGNSQTIQGPTGAVDCVVVEPDMDCYKDLLAHALLEVLPNTFTGGLTDPRAIYLLRWTAAKQAGINFDPLYTLTV